MVTVTVLILDLTVLGLASLISFLSYLAYQQKDEASYLYACTGFSILGISALGSHGATLMSSELVGEHVRAVMMIAGFGLLIYGGEIAE